MNRPLRIVLTLLEPPLPFGSAAARWYYALLKGLTARGHHVTALATASKQADAEAALKLFPSPQYDLRCFPVTRTPGLASKFKTFRRPYSYVFSNEMTRAVDEAMQKGADVLHLEQTWSGWLGLEHADRALLSVHYLGNIDWTTQNTDHWKSRFEKRLQNQTEQNMLKRYPEIRVLSQPLADEVHKMAPGATVSIAPLAFDLDLYRYIPNAEWPKEPVISLFGSMGWHPTLSAAKRLLTQLWPEIRKRVPLAHLQIVGWDAKSALHEFLGTAGVTIDENVPDIQPYFEKTRVLLYAPLGGSGMKVKVLEAFAWGIPVVTTRDGVEGLPADDGVHAGIAETDEALVERCVRLLEDDAQCHKQRLAARTLVDQVCDPGRAIAELEKIYGRILSRGEG